MILEKAREISRSDSEVNDFFVAIHTDRYQKQTVAISSRGLTIVIVIIMYVPQSE